MPDVSRRRLLKAAGTASIASIGGCLGDNSGTSGELNTIGISSYNTGAGVWIKAFNEGGQFYCEDTDYECNFTTHQLDAQEQVSDLKQLINQEVDAIVISPWGSEATVNDIEKAADEGIPVFTVNATAQTEAVELFVAFGNVRAAELCAEETFKALENQNPNQEKFDVLNVRGTFSSTGYQQRNTGFVKVAEQHDIIRIADTLQGESSRTAALTKVKDWINANGAPDAIYSANVSMGAGAYTALDQLDLARPKDHDEHIVLSQIDGGPEANQLIADGMIDLAVDQPNYFYMPLAVRYVEKYFEEGEEGIPEIGSEVTKDDLSIPPAQHKGVELWSEPIWAPGEIIGTEWGHPQLKTSGIVITQENADAPFLYGNIWG
jgi:ribose transport system substrate-binding protein